MKNLPVAAFSPNWASVVRCWTTRSRSTSNHVYCPIVCSSFSLMRCSGSFKLQFDLHLSAALRLLETGQRHFAMSMVALSSQDLQFLSSHFSCIHVTISA